MVRYHATPNGNVQFTAEEEAEWDAIQTAWDSKKVDRKLAQIKQIRLEKFMEFLTAQQIIFCQKWKIVMKILILF